MRARSWRVTLSLLLSSAWLIVSTGVSPQLLARAGGHAPLAQDTAVPRVNAPYKVPDPAAAIFWLGRVGPTENYADVRISYDDTRIFLHVVILDRRLWYDKKPSVEDLVDWDAVTVYLSKDGNAGNRPGTNAYRFEGQLVWWETRERYQAAYRGDGNAWVPADLDFETKSDWRSDDQPINDTDDRGWWLQYLIPFESLGLDGPPPQGTVWGLAVAVHDRDDAENTPIDDTLWPENMLSEVPATWGQLAFGLPAYSPPPVAPQGTTTVRHGLAGAAVVDADVGGSSVCGKTAAPDFFSKWGELNYAGQNFLNIQNQGDVADWPCFSKYYVTFPLDSIPAKSTIVSATLTLHLWGGAGSGANPGPEPSVIHVLSVGEDWDEATITWNNAPRALENISATLVEPIGEYIGRPGIPYDWDVSRAVIEARASGEPLRLAMYESDWAYHSGKYFDTSDTDDWGAEGRPTLKVTWGAPVETPYSAYLSLVLRTVP